MCFGFPPTSIDYELGRLTPSAPQPILDILAEMIAYDGSLQLGGMSMPGIPNLGNLGDMPTVGLD